MSNTELVLEVIPLQRDMPCTDVVPISIVKDNVRCIILKTLCGFQMMYHALRKWLVVQGCVY
jgi:hypothetical protein